jgi:heme exporter protein C
LEGLKSPSQPPQRGGAEAQKNIMSKKNNINNLSDSSPSGRSGGASYWWKLIAVIFILYTIIAGFLVPVPAQPILHETIRNLYFHVPMWFSMMTILFVSLWYSIKHLSNSDIESDIMASQAANTGMFVGILGLITGSLWARYTWGAWWVDDIKLNGAAATLVIYLAYIVLRGSIDEEQKRARVAAVFNIFAFVMLIVFLMILPRIKDSLHPGNGGNPGFNKYDLDSNMRMVFYPAVIGWILFTVWIFTLRVRIEKLKRKKLFNDIPERENILDLTNK